MNRRLFTNLPSEIITDILSRLPIKTIVSCKCVCKSWFELLNTPEFAKFHLSKSVPDLIICHGSAMFRIFEFVDELELESHELHYNLVLEFDQKAFISPPDAAICMEGSANGLLLLRIICMKPNPLYVSNPITREYFKLPDLDPYKSPTVAVYGFGVSMMSGQYKVVRILHDFVREPATGSILSISKSECRVYTLGTGSWRSIAHCNSYNYNLSSTGVFVSGNLHWLVADLSGSLVVSCLDLEAELFNFFSLPPLPGQRTFEGDLGISENCLCIRDNTSGSEMAIWEMKEYGIEKSWTKQIIISKLPDLCQYLATCPLKLFKDGDVLFSLGHFFMLYYSNKTKTTTRIDLFKGLPRDQFKARLHVSSFLSLKSFQLETFEKRNFEGIVDRRLNANEMNMEQVIRETKVSSWCIQEKPSQRPMMGKVVQMLEGVMVIDRPPAPKAITEGSICGTSITGSSINALSTFATSMAVPSSSSASGKHVDRASSSLLQEET